LKVTSGRAGASGAPSIAPCHGAWSSNGKDLDQLVWGIVFGAIVLTPAAHFGSPFDRHRGQHAGAQAGNYEPLGELLARAILDNLHKFVVPAVAGPSLLVPLPALASERISANALRVAATRGRLKASKAADGTWRSTRVWVEEYLSGRYEREP
jgi:hypothetical protein